MTDIIRPRLVAVDGTSRITALFHQDKAGNFSLKTVDVSGRISDLGIGKYEKVVESF